MTTKKGNQVRGKTIIGWKFLVNCKSGSQEWAQLKLFKESNPFEVAKFFTARNIADDPAFLFVGSICHK